MPNRLLVSVDNLHKPGSTTEQRDDTDKELNQLQSYKFQEGMLVRDRAFCLATGGQEGAAEGRSGASGRHTNLLYNLENLRKKEGEDKEE
jgi:tRNA (guanine-N(7)-)-methyltransferase subunit TRM82